MSCNGCRVLRKGCSDRCPLRSSLHWIPSPHSQAYATLFLAKFFGRSDLISFISSVTLTNRPALFQSLLFEACGRTINPVNGAVGLLCSGNWHLCQAAVDTVLSCGVLRPLPELTTPILDESPSSYTVLRLPMAPNPSPIPESLKRHGGDSKPPPVSLVTGGSEMTSYGICGHSEKKKLLNLFV